MAEKVINLQDSLHNTLLMFGFFRGLNSRNHRPKLGGLEILRFIGPGLLVTVGFTDPGNWAGNFSAGANYGYAFL